MNANEWFYSQPGFHNHAPKETVRKPVKSEPRIESIGGGWFTVHGGKFPFDRYGREAAERALALVKEDITDALVKRIAKADLKLATMRPHMALAERLRELSRMFNGDCMNEEESGIEGLVERLARSAAAAHLRTESPIPLSHRRFSVRQMNSRS